MLALAMLWAAPLAVTQARVQPRPAPPAHQAAPARAHGRKAHGKAAARKAAVTAPEPPLASPPAPIRPNWPVNDHPTPAAVVWDSSGLSIKANNSSLQQILLEVQTETGTKVQGLGPDERVYGVYGPGLARDVLSQLLEGSNYNVIMIGDLGKGAPRSILLSPHTPGGAAPPSAPAASNDDSTDAGDAAQPQLPPAHDSTRFGFVPGGAPHSPQQIMQELVQRQQQNPNQNPPQPH